MLASLPAYLRCLLSVCGIDNGDTEEKREQKEGHVEFFLKLSPETVDTVP